MVDVKIGGIEMRLRAAPPALLFYNQEFKRDLVTDAISVASGGTVDGLKIMRLVWAMNKMEHLGTSFPSFEKWIEQFEYLDLGDADNFTKVVGELQNGFFREAGKKETGEQ